MSQIDPADEVIVRVLRQREFARSLPYLVVTAGSFLAAPVLLCVVHVAGFRAWLVLAIVALKVVGWVSLGLDDVRSYRRMAKALSGPEAFLRAEFGIG